VPHGTAVAIPESLDLFKTENLPPPGTQRATQSLVTYAAAEQTQADRA
jgi:hypothetical protein